MDLEFEHFPVSDLIDHEILMHRNAHFGGKFEFMLEYYANEGKGVQEDFTQDRIEELYQIEHNMGEDLSLILLTETEIEKVAKSIEAYSNLREIYETPHQKNPLPLLISNLILSEEEHPEEEIEAIVEKKHAIVPYLHELLNKDEFYDPLFPGYGYAPILAAECLGKIGDVSSIPILFEKIGIGTFSNEDAIFRAMKAFGESAEKFLLKVLRSKPITQDNERAAIALIQFGESEIFSHYCLELLSDANVLEYPSLITYLVLGCEGLQKANERKEFLLLLNNPKISKSLHEDILLIAKPWFPELSTKGSIKK